jgi:hypothetical protein
MQVRILWKTRRTQQSLPAQRDQFRKAVLKAIRVNPATSIPIEDILRQLPLHRTEPYLDAVPPGVVGFHHPGRPLERTAVLDSRVRPAHGVRVFSGWQDSALAAWQPESLAGPLDLLTELAHDGPPLRLQRALIVFNKLTDPALSDCDRRLLWRAFQVPAYEQLRAPAGQLLAAECEAHAGLHVMMDRAFFELDQRAQGTEVLVSYLRDSAAPILRLATALTAEIDASPCACGVESPRLVGLRPRVRRRMIDAIAGAA